MARTIIEEEERGGAPLTVPPNTPDSNPPVTVPAVPLENGELLTSQNSVPEWAFASGDVDGPAGALVVRKLLGRPLSEAIPVDGQALTWSSGEGEWVPGTGGAPPAQDADIKAVGIAPSAGVLAKYAPADHVHPEYVAAYTASGFLNLATDFQHLYVAFSGSDSIGTGTSGAPYQTFQRAFKDVPRLRTKRVILHGDASTIDAGTAGLIIPDLGGNGSIVFSTHPVLGGGAYYGDVTFEGAIPTDLALGTVTQTPVAAAGALLDVRDSTKTWTLNQYRGHVVIDPDGDVGSIQGNATDGTLHVCNSEGFDSAGCFIAHAATVLKVTDAGSHNSVVTFPSDGTSVVFRGIKFASQVPNQNNTFFNYYGANVRFEICDFAALGSSLTSAASIDCFWCYLHPEDDVVGNAATFCGNTRATFTQCYLIGQRHLFGGAGQTVPLLRECYVENNIHPIAEGSGGIPNSGVQMFNCGLIATSVTIQENSQSFLTTVGWNGASSSGSGAGLYVANGAAARANQLLGNAGSGLGILVENDAHLFLDTTCTLTGSAGDMRCGLLPTRTHVAWNGTEPRQREHDFMGDGSSIEGNQVTILSTYPALQQRPFFLLTGATIPSASTIAPTAPQHPVSGTATISTMTPLYESEVTLFSLSDAWQVATGGGTGGFASAFVAVPGHHYSFRYLGSTGLWYLKG